MFIWTIKVQESLLSRGAKLSLSKKVQNGDNHCTVFLAVTKSGKKLPPLIVFKGTPGARIEKEVGKFPGVGQGGCLYAVQAKGWTDERIMLHWVEKIWIPFAQQAPFMSLLMIDSFRCHFVESVVNGIQGAGTVLWYIPGGGASKLQVLDVGINRPFK